MKIGVSGFKIVDRCLSARYQETMTRIYRQIIDLLEKGEIEAYEDALEAAKDIDMGLSPFFPQTIRKMCCEYQRCYYGPFYHVHRKVREVPG
jgi:collagenase-like PrtC family protease